MDNITLTFQHPAVIDGETDEVRETCVRQLAELSPAIVELSTASHKQIRNARLDEFLAQTAGDLDAASAKLTEWENGPESAALDRISRLAALIGTSAGDLAELSESS